MTLYSLSESLILDCIIPTREFLGLNCVVASGLLLTDNRQNSQKEKKISLCWLQESRGCHTSDFLSFGTYGKISLWPCKGIIVSLEWPVGLYVTNPVNGVKVRVVASLYKFRELHDVHFGISLLSYLPLWSLIFFSFLHSYYFLFIFPCWIVCIFVKFFKFSNKAW